MNVVMVLALVFLVLFWVVVRSGRVSGAEGLIAFLAGVFFWASGLGSILWGLAYGLYALTRGR